jgi:hypothetical protein
LHQVGALRSVRQPTPQPTACRFRAYRQISGLSSPSQVLRAFGAHCQIRTLRRFSASQLVGCMAISIVVQT